MITMIQPVSAGNALRVFLSPPAGAERCRLLRKGQDDFDGPEDAAAITVLDGDDRVILDDNFLLNEVPAYYRPYYLIQGVWTPGATRSGTPASSYEDHSVEVLPIIRERLELGFATEMARGEFSSRFGHIQVLTAPPSLEGSIQLPVITVHLDTDASAVRGIGEDVGGSELVSLDDGWDEVEGWLAQVQLSIIAWSHNADERLDLGIALRRIIVANLPVFDAHGMVNIDFRQQHVDALSGEYPANIYQVLATFSCMAPVRVGHRVGAVRTVESTVITP